MGKPRELHICKLCALVVALGWSTVGVTSLRIAPTIPQDCNRRTILNRLAIILPVPSAAAAITGWPQPSYADLNSAAVKGVPLLGRFERLTGAKSFIGQWNYEATTGPSGELVFLKNGEVELRSLTDSSVLIGVGAVPWKYVSMKGKDTIVSVSFTIDAEGQDNVLIFQGTFDSAGGPGRIMEGSIETGRAEVGARDSGPRKQVGSFKARFVA